MSGSDDRDARILAALSPRSTSSAPTWGNG